MKIIKLYTLALVGIISLSASPSSSQADFRQWIQGQPGLVSFWDFQAENDNSFQAVGREKAGLLMANDKVSHEKGDGVFGDYSVKISEGGYMFIPREKLGKLNIHGKEAQVTVVAWMKSESEKYWQAIAGVWNESRSKRQYYLFMNARAASDYRVLERFPCQNRIHGHISALGGKTPGKKAWVSYASGGTDIKNDTWHMIGMTYDGQFIRVYLDGKLDSMQYANPFPYEEGIFDGGGDGADFTVGSNSVRNAMENYFVGKIGGLAVFESALSEEVLSEMYKMSF